MEVSKLEALPNEIFIELFEKYINGVDIFTGFYSLNQRFNGLISQCQRFSLNFYHCQKESFQNCLTNLLATSSMEKIEELILSEEYTPDQIQIFLAFFPTFHQFRQLRKLYFHSNSKPVIRSTITQAIRSLSNTVIEIFSLQMIDTPREVILDNAIDNIMSFQTLKKFYLNGHIYHNRLILFDNDSLEPSYLTHLTISCELRYLDHIFQRCSYLEYLNIHITSDSIFGYQHLANPGNGMLTSISNLRTLLLSFPTDDLTTFDMLTQYLRLMSVLNRLEIKANSTFLDALAWQTFLETSLLSLNYFILKTTKSRIQTSNMENLLSSFETSFWREKQNFYFIITEHRYMNDNHIISIRHQDEFQSPVIRWWIVPMRTLVDPVPTKHITNLALHGMAKALSQYYSFNYIQRLVFYNLDNELLKWLETYVNCSRIKYLDLSCLNSDSDTIISNLPFLKNIVHLRIQFHHLFTYQNIFLEKQNNVEYLDISINNHDLSGNGIIVISKLFPSLKHLSINTSDFLIIPLLKIYLPKLYSLTYKARDNQRNFLYQRNQEWTTIWIDQSVYNNPQWEKFNSNSSTISTNFQIVNYILENK